MNIINLELRKLGLKEKEVSVYLAALELGFDSVQNIAKRTGLSRPTVYEIIKALTGKGLMREIKRQGAVQGQRSYFAAESPDALLGLLRVQKREVEEREREFVRIISSLRAQYNLAGQTEIRSFLPDEIKFLLDDFSQSQTEDIIFIGSDTKALKSWQAKLPAIKKRLGSVNLKELKKSLPGALIIYDKLIYLPTTDKSALLIENKFVIELIKSLL
ncbi:helix-turn-helix domain-containing protein [Patescibacteria group bacterium]|nr:helix-turn-helix domain-containing protein [Patescibacteria group bacterium]